MSEPAPQQQDLPPPPPPQEPEQPPQPSTQPEPQKPTQPAYTKPERPRKVYDTLLDSWYYNEVNKRVNEEPEIFKNYQINPYTKKTLDYVTPKITERRKSLPKEFKCPDNCTIIQGEDCPFQTEEDKRIIESYKLVKRAMDRSVNPPMMKFCEPQTEAMRLGWFKKPPPPPTNLQAMYIKTCWSPTECIYLVPRQESELTQNEQYDERFRATHKMAEFIRTETKLKQFDAIMNPDGIKGQRKSERILPRRLSRGLQK